MVIYAQVSHYPQNLKLGRVAGTGMNERELRANTQLTEFTPVCKSKFYGAIVLNRRVDLYAIDATPARWRGDAGSSPLAEPARPRHRREMT